MNLFEQCPLSNVANDHFVSYLKQHQTVLPLAGLQPSSVTLKRCPWDENRPAFVGILAILR